MRRSLIVLSLLAIPVAAQAQGHVHTEGMVHTPGMMMADGGQVLPTMPGQAAFGAIAEIVRLLEADSTTDWSRVDLEALRQHLIDMNEVTLNAAVRQTAIPGGLRIEVTGTGRTRDAIRRMLAAHAATLDGMPDYAASAEEIPDGILLTVRAKEPGDARAEAKIRGLGFIGLLTLGDHHPRHHLALARGDSAPHSH